MKSDEQQPPQPPSHWLYDQRQPPDVPVEPPHAYSPSNNPPQVPSGNLPYPGANEPPASYDPDLTMDMGSSLGYGQSMEYRTSSMPQPTHEIPRLRNSRLLQLRQERLSRIDPDATIRRPRKDMRRGKNKSAALPDDTRLGYPSGGSNGPFAPPQPPPVPVMTNVAMPSAAAPAQDTGMIQRSSVARAAFLITGAFMFSSFLGLVRTFLFSYVFGATSFSDAYLQAYVIPNLIFTVISGGALSSAFIPVFTKYADGLKDEKSAWHIASSALNLSVVIMIVLSVIAMIFAPVIVPLYSGHANLALITTLTRIMLLQAIVLGSGVIVSSVLNAKQDFTLTALGTVLYNVGLIAGLLPGLLLAFHSRSNTLNDLTVYSATWGVVLAAILQVGVQIPGLFKVKMHYTFSFDWRHPGVRQVGRQMVPRMINSAMLSFSTVVDRSLLSFLGTVVSSQLLSGLITEYFQAFSILVLPVSIFGSSVSTAAFPTLASYVARERFDRVRSIIMETLRGILFLSIPSSIGLMVLALPVVQVLLEHGHFTLQNAQFTAIPLIFFATGLPGLAAVEILTRAFYALRDSTTPVVVSVAQFILKIALSIALINVSVFGVQWGMGALAFSTAIASTLEAVVLFILLYRRIGGLDLHALSTFIVRALFASAMMGVALFIARLVLDAIIHTTSANTLAFSGILLAMVKLLLELGIGSVVFLFIAKRLNMEEMNSGPVRRLLVKLHITWL